MKGEGLEKLTDGKYTHSGVHLRGAQNRNSAAPERSTYMPSDDDIRIISLYKALSESEKKAFIQKALCSLAEQSKPSSVRESHGEANP